MPSQFIPTVKIIIDIPNGHYPTVTTDSAHSFTSGDVVRIFVPKEYGMALYVETSILVTGADTFIIFIDTTNDFPFVVPSEPYVRAQAIGINGPVDNVIT